MNLYFDKETKSMARLHRKGKAMEHISYSSSNCVAIEKGRQ